MADRDKLVSSTAHWLCFGRNTAQFDRFRDGLAKLGVLDAITVYPKACRPALCVGDDCLTAAAVDQLFTPRLSEVGSNSRAAENLILSWWKDFLMDLEDVQEDAEKRNADSVTLESVLYFSTECRSIPPLGFAPSPTVAFLHDENSCRFRKANTCSNAVKLPVSHTSYATFVADLTFAIGNTGGFGFALGLNYIENYENVDLHVLERRKGFI